MSLYGAVWDHRSHRASPWKPSFGFSVGFPPFFPVAAPCSSLLGRVWEGATAPLPIKNWVSEANSFLPPLSAEFSSYPQALACVLNIHVFFVFRARDHFMRRLEKREIQLEKREIQLEKREIQLEKREKNSLTTRYKKREILD